MCFSCMGVNGQTQGRAAPLFLRHRPHRRGADHEDYISAETVLRMQQTSGERSAMFKSSPLMGAMVAELRRAEAEAEILCF